MANTLGAGTMMRCAWHMARPNAKTYELSYVRSGTMPLSAFSGPYVTKPKPTASIPGTAHAFNLESFGEGAEPGQQATQIDALGHFGFLKQPWDGKGPVPVEGAVYYGGYTQKDVKPTPDSPLLKLGMEKAPPIVTSAVLLDAKTRRRRTADKPRMLRRNTLNRLSVSGSKARHPAGRRGYVRTVGATGRIRTPRSATTPGAGFLLRANTSASGASSRSA